MNKVVEANLLHSTPLNLCSEAVRTCWDSGDKSDSFTKAIPTNFSCDECGSTIPVDTEVETVCGPKDKELIDRVGNKFKHASSLEHLVYWFEFKHSRALLQELARHRISSLSVKSTRYTLKELKEEETFTSGYMPDYIADDAYSLTSEDYEYKDKFYTEPEVKRANKYLIFTGNILVDLRSVEALENLREVLKAGVSNDVAKYCLPESYRTTVRWTVNARSLQNFLTLRSNKSALWEIRQLAEEVFNKLPHDHKYLFEHCMYKEEVK